VAKTKSSGAPTLTDTDKTTIFRSLKTESYYKVGLSFGLDKYYSSAASVRKQIQNVFNEVKNDPDKFGIPIDEYSEILEEVEKRGRLVNSKVQGPTLREKNELAAQDVAGLVMSARDKTLLLLNEKLDRITKSKSQLDKITLKELSQVYSTTFEKGQIMSGEATEHVTVLSKNININMTPQEAIDLVVKMRETNDLANDRTMGKK